MTAGPDLDALVAAKVFGREVMPPTSFSTWGVRAPTSSHAISVWEPLPPYSTDIKAAWFVVKKLLTDGHHIMLSTGHNYQRQLRFAIGVRKKRAAPEGSFDIAMHDTITMYDAIADTAPLAICLATLKWAEQLS